MRVRISYTMDGDPVVVTTNLANIVAWERKFKRKASDMATAAGVEDLAFLAWEASKSAKVVVPAVFDEFISKLTDIGIEEHDAPHPSHAAPTDTH